MHYWRWSKYGDPTKVLKSVMAPTKVPTDLDIAWTTGFLEGEGSFDSTGTTARVSAGQVQKEPLERLLAFFGGSLRPRKSKVPTQKDQWIWTVCGARARGVMMTLYSLMSPRRQEQISKALQPKQEGLNG